MMTEIEKLKARWLRKTGDDMPQSIAALDLDTIRRAVRRTEAGEIVFVPGVPVTTKRSDESFMEWDHGGEF